MESPEPTVREPGPALLEITEGGRLIDPTRTQEAERQREEEAARKGARDEGWQV
jgi:hypothetical protein